MDDGVIDGQSVVVREVAQVSLLEGSPSQRIEQATAIATALAPVIEQRKLYAEIQGKRHFLFLYT